MTTPDPQLQVDDLADGVHALVAPGGGWCVSNAGLVVGDDLVVLVDSASTQRRAAVLRDEVLRLAGRLPDVLVTTHFHGDHHFGHSAFAPPALVVSHPAARAAILVAGLAMKDLWPDVDWGEITLRPPTTTVADGTVLHAGPGLPLELRHLGTAHTAGDLVAWLPEQRVLFAGDVAMSGVTPFCLMGSIAGSIAVLDELVTWEPRAVVTGHGPVGGPEVLRATAAYLRWVRELADDGRRRGLTALELARETGAGPWSHLRDPERLVPNLCRAYAEAEAEEAGRSPQEADLDIAGAYRQMVEYLGAPPVSRA